MGRVVNNGRRQSGQGSDDEQQVSGMVPLPPNRIIYISGDITEQQISAITSTMFVLAGQDPHKPIQLIVSTYGGVIDEMFGMYDVMQFIPCEVQTVGIGKIMSAGVLLLAAGAKGSRQISENSRVMIHSIRGGAVGNIFEIINETDEMKRMQRKLTDLLVKHSSMTVQQVEKYMKAGHDCYITPDEAVKLGLVDTIIPDKFKK